ncbi:MAG: hypothetical protein ABL999_13135 [Pyrinomonadaceae bacterium]
MRNIKVNFTRSVAVLLLTLVFSTVLAAQQTIFNVPSTDIMAKGKVYLEFDAVFKTTDQSSLSRFSSFVPRFVVGVGENIEVGLNVTGNIQPGADATTLVPAVKWKVYDGKDNGWAIAVGDNLYIPVRNKAYNIGNYAYAQASKTFKSGTRLTAGAYHFSKNTVASNANRAGGQFGFEQVVNKYLNINADWYTGKHAAGYFTPGVAIKLHPKVAAYAGYSIGNTGASNGNHFFYTAIGVNIN